MKLVMTTRRTHGPNGSNPNSTRISTPPPGILLAVGETFKVPTHFHTQDEVRAYRHFHATALRVSVDGFVHFRNDPDLAVHNIAIGLKNLAPHYGAFAARCPDVSLVDALELPALALALSHATRLTIGQVSSPREIARRRADVRELHEDMENVVGVLVRRGALDAKVIAGLGTKRGPIAKASDGVAIAGVYRDHAKSLDGKHPFTKEDIEHLATESAWIRAALKPANARKEKAVRSPESIVRDQFAKLLGEGHDKLRTAGVVFFGIRNVDEKVPPLYSAAVGRSKNEDEGGEG